MKADYVHKDTLTSTDYVDLQKENKIIISYNQQLLKENKDLKRQLEDITLCRDIASGHRQEVQDRETILLNQQQEFIKYLEDLIKQNETVVEVSKYGLPKNCSKLLIDFYKYILSKYKSIIGVEDEK